MIRGKDAVRFLIAASVVSLETALPLAPFAFAQEPVICDTASCDSCDGLPISDGCDGFSVHGARNSIWTRDTLTGDWGGRRSALRESGITFAGRSTHFGFGVEGGIQAPPPVPLLGTGDTFKYTGRGEYDLIFDLEKFGGLPNFKKRLQW